MTNQTDAAETAAAEASAVALNQPEGEKTYLEPKVEQTEGEEAQSGDDAAAAQTEGEGGQPKPKKSAQERINELTAARREAEREAEYWRSKATQAPQPVQAQPVAADSRPDPSTYNDGAFDPQYIEDLTDWKAAQAVERRFTQHEAQSRTQTAIQAFDQKVAEQYPDGEPAGITALRRAPVLAQTIVDLVTSSEIGPKLADHLGDNPRELARLSALPPHLQGREITKLELKLATPPAPSPKTATDAPEPAPTLRGAGGRFKVAPDTSDFAAFEAQYKLGG